MIVGNGLEHATAGLVGRAELESQFFRRATREKAALSRVCGWNGLENRRLWP